MSNKTKENFYFLVFSRVVTLISLLAVLSKLARQITFIFIESKVIFRKNATGARPRANPCNNSGETEEVAFYCFPQGKAVYKSTL